MYTSIFSTNTTESQVLDTWLELMDEYGSLKLPKQVDRLPVISGLASRVATRLSGEYLAGLWSQDLPRALCWEKGTRSSNNQPSFRHASVSASPWSWVSVWNHSDDIPGITYGVVAGNGFVVDPRCRIQGFHRSRSLANPFGIFGDARLMIQGPLIEATFLVTKSPVDLKSIEVARERDFARHLRKTVIWNEIEFHQETSRFTGDSVNTERQVTDISHGDLVYCLLLGRSKRSEKEKLNQYPSQYLSRDEEKILESEESSIPTMRAYALVLVRVDAESTYRRAGFLIRREGADWWEGAEIRDILLL